MFNSKFWTDILKLNVGIAQRDNALLFERLQSLQPLKLYNFPSGLEHNGWVIPADWKVKRASVYAGSTELFDGSKNLLSVAANSCSFSGELSKEELSGRTYTKKTLPEATPYHCSFSYRPWGKDWALCLPEATFSTWKYDNYRVELETELSPGQMTVGELHIEGQSEETVVFNAHTCHPGQFNDGFIGVASILEVFSWLASRSNYYSYRAVFGPEHIGTIFYLANLPERERKRLKACVFTEMTGIEAPLVLQQSFTGDSALDQIAETVLREFNSADGDGGLKVGEFRSIVGNDETVWEAPGVEIPCISVSRCYDSSYYPEYHTDFDTVDRANLTRMNRAISALKAIVEILEEDRIITRKFDGLVSLANPKYNLYIRRPDPTEGFQLKELDLRLGKLQDFLPRYFDGNHSVFEIAKSFGIPFDILKNYLLQFKEKGLADLGRPASLDWYSSSSVKKFLPSNR
jgi:aminopeptidase-like protein